MRTFYRHETNQPGPITSVLVFVRNATSFGHPLKEFRSPEGGHLCVALCDKHSLLVILSGHQEGAAWPTHLSRAEDCLPQDTSQVIERVSTATVRFKGGEWKFTRSGDSKPLSSEWKTLISEAFEALYKEEKSGK